MCIAVSTTIAFKFLFSSQSHHRQPHGIAKVVFEMPVENQIINSIRGKMGFLE